MQVSPNSSGSLDAAEGMQMETHELPSSVQKSLAAVLADSQRLLADYQHDDNVTAMIHNVTVDDLSGSIAAIPFHCQ